MGFMFIAKPSVLKTQAEGVLGSSLPAWLRNGCRKARETIVL